MASAFFTFTFIALSITVLGYLNQHMIWILDVHIVYFLAMYYLFGLSIVILFFIPKLI